MPRILIFSVLLLVTCAPNPAPTNETVASAPMTAAPPLTAESNVPVNQQDSISDTIEPLAADSSLYIGEIESFPETGELYTPVYYNNLEAEEGLFQRLSKQTDSLIYTDNDHTRRRLPYAVARKYFNLSGLNDIFVYKQGQLVGQAEFIRVEYLEDIIQGHFIAVFKPTGLPNLSDELDYCISTGEHSYKTVDITYEVFEDEQLTESFLETFIPRYERIRKVSHTRVNPYHSVYSAIAMESRSLLIETNEGQSRILKDLKNDWYISHLTPLHLECNGKPILLLAMGVNETDITWNSVAISQGGEYVFAEYNRVPHR